MDKKLYDPLKFIAQVALPAAGTLYAGVAALWGLPNVEAVGGTVLAVDAFLGALLQLSSAAYNKATLAGAMVVTTAPSGKTTYGLELDGDPAKLADQERVTFKVTKT